MASCSRPPHLHLTLPPAGEAFNYDTKYTRSTALPSLLKSTTEPEPEPEPDSDSDWLVSEQTKSWTHVCVFSGFTESAVKPCVIYNKNAK